MILFYIRFILQEQKLGHGPSPMNLYEETNTRKIDKREEMKSFVDSRVNMFVVRFYIAFLIKIHIYLHH